MHGFAALYQDAAAPEWVLAAVVVGLLGWVTWRLSAGGQPRRWLQDPPPRAEPPSAPLALSLAPPLSPPPGAWVHQPADDAWLGFLPCAALLLDEELAVVTMNPSARALFAACNPAALTQALRPLLVTGGTQATGEIALDSCSGPARMIDMSARRIERPADHGVPVPQWLVLLRDITEVVHQRRVAESHRQRLLQTLDATGMAVWEWDLINRQVSGSARGWRIIHGDQPPPGPMPLLMTLEEVNAAIHPEDRARVQQMWREGIQHHETFEYRCRGIGHVTVGSGTESVRMPVWVHSWAQVQRDAQGRAVTVRGLMRDVTTEQHQASQAQRSREELQRLSACLLEAREDERKHIARELHDELGQRLSLLKMSLSQLVRDGEESGLPSTIADPLAEALDEADDIIRALRRIAADLRPPMLDDLGLVESIRWLAQDSSSRLTLDIHTELDDPGDLPPPIAIAVFRMVQEAIHNAHRHAQARTLTVRLQADAEALTVSACDDGVGYTPAVVRPGDKPARGWGLIGIRERASLLGGHFRIGARSQGGTELRLWLPRPSVARAPGEAAAAAWAPHATT